MKTKKLLMMTKLRRTWNRIVRDRKGQSTTEYILILAIVVMLAGKLKPILIGKVTGVATNLDLELKDQP